jgi:predicted ATPase/DNA-binding SARP family transcriptional activator
LKRGDVAFALWPDDPEDDARAKLRRHLYRLLRALPNRNEPWILADEMTLHWNGAGDAWFDVAAFEAGVRDEARMQEAVDYYTGDLLSQLEDEWVVPLREHLRASYTAALGSLVRRAHNQNDFGAALQFVHRLLASDPWREDALRQLMTLRYETGDRAGALHAFEQFERRLREYLDVDPMPETRALRDSILYLGQPPDPPAHRNERTRPGGQSLPFVGRGSEMEFLSEHWSRATLGRGHVVLIGGEAGIGKTRLARQLSRLAEIEGARVLWGATSSPESIPYQSLADALRSALSSITELPLEPLCLASLAQVLPEVRARRPDIGMPASIDPEAERTRLFEAIALALESLAQTRPLLVVLEDLHWAAAATIAALEFVARRLAPKAILIVGTYRAEATHPMHAVRELRRRLQAEKALTHVAVTPLARRDVDELLGKFPALCSEREKLVPHLHAICNGNPLFLAQAVRDILEGGAPAAASETLQGLLATRLARLSPQTRKLAQMAATIGTAFNVEVLRQTSDWSEDAVLEALDELQARNLVREPQGQQYIDYAFAHEVIRGTIYESSAPDARRRYHRRVARALESLYPTRRAELAGELARQYEGGGENEAAAACYLDVARGARAVYADDEALDAIGRGLDLTTEPRVRANFLFERDGICSKRDDPDAQQAGLAELAELVEELNDDELHCALLDRRILFEYRRCDLEHEALYIEELLRRAEMMGSRRWRAVALQRRARNDMHSGRYSRAREAIDEAIAFFEQTSEIDEQIVCYCLRIDLAAQMDCAEMMRATMARVRSLPQRGSRNALEAVVESAMGAALTLREFREAMRLARELLEIGRAGGNPGQVACGHGGIALAARALFDMPLAREQYELAREGFTRLGDPFSVAGIASGLGSYFLQVGLLDQAREEFAAANHTWSEIGFARGIVYTQIFLSRVECYREDYAQAASLARAALVAARATENPLFEGSALRCLAMAELGLEEVAQAEEHLRAALPLVRSGSRPTTLNTLLADYAVVHTRTGDLAQAVECADEALEICRRAGLILEEPEAIHWQAACVYRAAGDRARSQQLLAAAAALRAERAAALTEKELRCGYLSLPWNREIDAAVTRDEWPAWLNVCERVPAAAT